MPKFDVFYYKAKRDLEYGEMPPDMDSLVRNYQCLKVGVEAENREELYWQMQGENWSRNDEARDEILALGLSHTSMSVGDIILNETGELWFCAEFGWKRLFPDVTVPIGA